MTEIRELLTAWRAKGRRTVHEADAKRILTLAGIAVPGSPGAGPCVVKWCHDDFPHKTEHGLVQLNVEPTDVPAVLARMERKAAAGTALVEAMIRNPVAEFIVGCRVDRTFGPIVMAGVGGVLVELLQETEIRLAPVDEATADDMIGRGSGGRLLDGFRGRPKGDREALKAMLGKVSQLFHDHSDLIEELEVNPILTLPQGEGAVAADALIILRQPN